MTPTLSGNHFHAWFIPGEDYDGTDRYYLGFLMASGETVRTGTSMTFAGQSVPNSTDTWSEFVDAKGASISKSLPLALCSWFIDDSAGYVIPVGMSDGDYNLIWYETTQDLSESISLYYGKTITFIDGSIAVVAQVPAEREPGTSMWKLRISGTPVEGAARIGSARILPAEEIWWENWLKGIVDVGSVGILELAYGVRDDDTETVPLPYCVQQYKCLLKTAMSKAVYGNSAYFTYQLDIHASLYDADDEEAAMSTQVVTGLVASDKTYQEKILLTWEALDGASLYQVYASNSHTRPDAAEQQASWPYVSTSDNCVIAEIPAESWATGGTTYGYLGITHGATSTTVGGVIYYQTGAALDEGVHRFYWVRAKVSNDNAGEEWSDWSEMAHGVTSIIPTA